MPSQPIATDISADQKCSPLMRGVILALTLGWCIYWFVHAWRYWEDDAYIHLEFARSIAQGRGFAFNGHIVAGDTAPLWVFLLVAMHTLISNWLIAGKVLTVLGAILGLSGAYAFARSLAASMLPPFEGSTYLPAVLVLLIVVNPYFCYWSFSGMEPIAASGLACFAVLAATRNQPSTISFGTGCLLAGIAPLMRPEMIFLTALLALPLLGQWRRLPASPAKPATFAAGLLLLVGPLAAWSLYSLHAFGHLIPNTNAAKRAGPSDSVLLRLLNVYALGLPLVLVGLIAAVVYLIARPSSVRKSVQAAVASIFARTSPTPSRSLPLGGWIFILWPTIATVFYIANHTYVQTRYILVTAPSFIIVILIASLAACPRTARALYLAALVWSLAISVIVVRPFLRNKTIGCLVTRDLALYIHDHIPPGAPVADYSIGEIAFVSQHPIIDTGGITRPGAIPYLSAPPEAMLRWASSEGAQYAIGSGAPEPGAVAVHTVNAPFIGWTLDPSLYSTSGPVSLWKLPPTQP